MDAKNTEIKKKEFLAAFEKLLGNVTQTCRQVKMARSQYYYWREHDEEFKKKSDEVGEIVLDFAESALHKQINEGNTTATIFLLKCKGKNRGYTEKQELELSGEVTNRNVEIVFKDDIDEDDIGFVKT